MNTDARTLARQLYDLLPAVYRVRDADLQVEPTAHTTGLVTTAATYDANAAVLDSTDPARAQYLRAEANTLRLEADLLRRPLFNLVAIIAEQSAVAQEGLEQAYDDLFIETCARWVVPYIGDLIGSRPLHGKAKGLAGGRSEVANTLALRRRKGTLAALEQIARDVTGYPAVAVEFFERMALTQYMNHLRHENLYTLDVRDEIALERLNTPFDASNRTLEVRRISSGRGKYNIQNIGLFLFRIQSFALTGANAARIDDFRYIFNPLGIDTTLYNNPLPEGEITDFAKPENVSMPISRLVMERDKAAFYGTNASLVISVSANGDPVDPAQVVVCNLSDKADGSGDWIHAPVSVYAVDPALGRLALPNDTANFPMPDPENVTVSFRYGFSDALGSGEYERGSGITGVPTAILNAASTDVQAALTAAAGGGIVEFEDSRTYTLASGSPNVQIPDDQTLEIRARNQARPLLNIEGGAFVIEGGDRSNLIVDGLVIAGGRLRITGAPASVTLRHCTVVPGTTRTRQNEPDRPNDPVLVITSGTTAVQIEHCIIGQIQAANGASVTVRHSIIDATGEARLAFSGGESGGNTLSGASLDVENSTIIGRVHTRELTRASNVIFAARPVPGAIPVRSDRTQAGCVRFSAVPAASRTPKRYRCTTIAPRFTSLQYGMPGYCQLDAACDQAIRSSADDGSEMGVFHDLFQPQRESDLRTRLDEFMRYGMEPGVFYAS